MMPIRAFSRFHKNRIDLIAIAIVMIAAVPVHAESFYDDVMKRDKLTGDWGGARTYLGNHGLDLGFTETLESLANTSGGTAQGGVVEGQFEMALDVDFEKLAGAKGLTGHINAFQIHGNGLSAANLNANTMTVSGIEAERATRLFEAWLQQSFMDDQISVRAGKLAADEEFATSDYAGLFVNSEYGWADLLAVNLPNGGPGYPLSAPGVRVKLGQADPWSVQMAVYAGDPAGHGNGNTAQQMNSSGTNFDLDKGALLMNEVAYGKKGDLPGTYKLGMWYHTGNADDLRFGTDGLSLADASSNGNAIQHHGNYGFYGVVDQKLWDDAAVEGGGIGAFTRFYWNPDDRNVNHWQWDIGANWKGMIAGRADDTFGIAFSYISISDNAAAYDRDSNIANSTTAPVRDYEAGIEVTYQAQITPWFSVQPDFQYIFHPGGNVANPNDASGTAPVEDAAIFGVRAVFLF